MQLRYKLLGTVFLTALIVQAHEFWLEPQKFIYKVGEKAEIDFLVGENFNGEKWDFKRDRIIKLEQNSPRTTTNILDAINNEGKLVTTLSEPGTHVLTMQSNNAFIELEAEKFNEYLKEEGLEEIVKMREKDGTTNSPSKEYYARYAKLMLQVGDSYGGAFRKEIGMPLEIVPLTNPYTVKQTGEIKFKLLLEGKPLPFTLVKVWNRNSGRTFLQNIYSQKDGTITTRLSDTGLWMISSVKMIPSKEEGADWQSYWTSLVFGFDK